MANVIDIDAVRSEITRQKAKWQPTTDRSLESVPIEVLQRRLGVKRNEARLQEIRKQPKVDLDRVRNDYRKQARVGPAPIPIQRMQANLGRQPGMGTAAPGLPPRPNGGGGNGGGSGGGGAGAPAAAVDWRTRNGRNFVTPVKDQGQCGSCVAFGTAAVLESMVLIEHQLSTDVSEADLFFCGGAHCANGWWPDDAIARIRDHGVSPERCFPYPNESTSNDVLCRPCGDRDSEAISIGSSVAIYDVGQRKQYLQTIGPMSACFDVYADFFAYKSGVYSYVTGDKVGGHCVEIVGFDDGQGCWICKNSWGAGWGDSGFFRIAYGQCGIDSDWKLFGVIQMGSPFWGVGGTRVPASSYWVAPFISGSQSDVLEYSRLDESWRVGHFAGTTIQWTKASDTSGFGQVGDGRPIWAGRFSRPSQADILFYYPGDRNWWLGQFAGTNINWALSGNTNGFGQVWDGRPFWVGNFARPTNQQDVLFYYPGDKNWWLGEFSGTTLNWQLAGNTAGFGQVADGRPFWTGKFSGTGRSEILFYYPGDHNWWLGRFHASGSDHFYTSGAAERDNAVSQYNYSTEGTACYVFDYQSAGTIPLYRLRSQKDHFYTTSAPERDNAVNQYGYVSEGIACYVFGNQAPGTTPLYRLFNGTSGDHFYTTSAPERDNAINQAGYQSEGTACFVFSNQAANTVPLFRLYGGGATVLDWNLAGNTAGFGQVWDGRPFWTGRFVGGNQTDVLFYYPGDQNWWLGHFNGTQMQWSLAGNMGRMAEGCPMWVGDFNASGKDQFLFYDPKNSNWWSTGFTGTTYDQPCTLLGNTAGFGQVWDGRPIWTADFVGDGHSDILFYFPGDENWWLGRVVNKQLTWNLAGNTAGVFV
ncbi:MAG: hypothetical protein M3077_09160 [Candidatus Dormibacteraeota bacterium]|nr:hypothetical protein [Candidatus Dormibacteraeota bacterium]